MPKGVFYMNMSKKEYRRYVQQLAPKSPIGKTFTASAPAFHAVTISVGLIAPGSEVSPRRFVSAMSAGFTSGEMI